MGEYDILGRLVAADEAAGEPQTFVMTYHSQRPVFAGVRGWPDDMAAPSEHCVDELADRGWVRVSRAEGKTRTFAVTSDGRRAWRERVDQLKQVGIGGVTLEWPAARALLQRIYEKYVADGAPELGVYPETLVDDDERPAVDALVRELVRGGYLDIGWSSSSGPRAVRPATEALKMFAGWPAGTAQDSLNELVRAIQAEVEQTGDAEKRSRLIQVRDGLIGAARDVSIAYFEKKMLGL